MIIKDDRIEKDQGDEYLINLFFLSKHFIRRKKNEKVLHSVINNNFDFRV